MTSQTPQTTPKAVSSRLLSMKFMQRGAASPSSSPNGPKSDAEHSAKRRKTSNGSHASTPNTPIIDQAAVQAALEEEDRKRQAAIERQAAELGDSHWVLESSVLPTKSGRTPQTPLKVIHVGFAQIDTNISSENSSAQSTGFTPSDASKFRRFNMKKSSDKNNSSSNNRPDEGASDVSDDDSSGSSSSQSGARGRSQSHQEGKRKRSKSSVSSKRSAERNRANEYAEKRRKKDVNLNQLTSISSQGGQSQSWQSQVKCYRCGKTGHIANKCGSRR